ncbi:MAG: phage tail tape measure protein, partial [Mucinivorans sp.]
MSTKTVSYILSLLDRASAPMQAITGNSVALTGRLGKMQSQAKTLQAVTNDLGGSLMTLRQRMDLLRAEKDLINPKNLTDLKRYNREIGSLEQQIDKLDRAGTKKGGLLQSLKSTGLVGGMGMAMAAGAGLSLMGGGAMKLDDQFAKVNVTAQMEGDSLLKLKSDILNVAKKNKVDVAVAPEAFEKILSQTNDVDFSLDILNSTLKGSKAGFTDTATVAEALAQSLSIVGKENATANQMLDTFFAAKRVGAGEFKDF